MKYSVCNFNGTKYSEFGLNPNEMYEGGPSIPNFWKTVKTKTVVL